MEDKLELYVDDALLFLGDTSDSGESHGTDTKVWGLLGLQNKLGEVHTIAIRPSYSTLTSNSRAD